MEVLQASVSDSTLIPVIRQKTGKGLIVQLKFPTYFSSSLITEVNLVATS